MHNSSNMLIQKYVELFVLALNPHSGLCDRGHQVWLAVGYPSAKMQDKVNLLSMEQQKAELHDDLFQKVSWESLLL